MIEAKSESNWVGFLYGTSFDLNTMLTEDIRRIVISILKLFTGEKAISIYIGKLLKCPVKLMGSCNLAIGTD